MTKYIFSIVILAALAGVGVSGPLFDARKIDVKMNLEAVSKGEVDVLGALTTKTLNNKNRRFDEVKIEAESAVLTRVSDGEVIYSKNPDSPAPVASLAKLVTAVVVSDILGSEGDFKWAVPITTHSILQDGDSGFISGEHFYATDLLKAALIASSNDAAFALAEFSENLDSSDRTFVERMNMFAEGIGLGKTEFMNPTGLEISEEKGVVGSVSTANEFSKVVAWIYNHKPEILFVNHSDEAVFSSIEGREYRMKSTYGEVSFIPGLIGIKTGFTDLAGGNVVAVFANGLNEKYIAVILGSTKENRFDDLLSLYKTTAVDGL